MTLNDHVVCPALSVGVWLLILSIILHQDTASGVLRGFHH